jgi:hypothetical protein
MIKNNLTLIRIEIFKFFACLLKIRIKFLNEIFDPGNYYLYTLKKK